MKAIFYLIIPIIGAAIFLSGCGNGGSSPIPTSNNDDVIPDGNPNIITNYLHEIDYLDLPYYHDNDNDTSFDVGMNRDASKVIYSFYSRRKLYVLLYSNGQWQDPVLLGNRGYTLSSQKTHRVIMNNDGNAALIHFGSRVGTAGTFAVSYFDGNDWQYTIEVPGTPIIDIHNNIICDIDSDGIAYIVSIPDNYNSKKEFTVLRFDSTGIIDTQTFASGIDVPGTTFGLIFPKAIAINDFREVMLVYYYIEEANSWPGFTALFDGVNWSISQDWTPNPDVRWKKDPGKLQYNSDGSAYLVYGNNHEGLTYANYNSGVWSNLYEGVDFSYDFREPVFTLNEQGDELMVLREDNGLHTSCYRNNDITDSLLSSSSSDPISIFHLSSGAYIALYWRFNAGISRDPVISYHFNGAWAEGEQIINKWRAYYYMNRYGYLVIADSYMISISKFDDSLLN